jgi:UDP-N-acetylglucosamine acyltransferase
MKAHPTAIIHPHAQVAGSVTVGPYTVIGENVEIGADSEIMSHVVIDGHTRLGKGNKVYPWASVGLAPQDLKYQGEPTRVDIGDGNTLREFLTIHRGTGETGVTRIGDHNLLMAYVHIAHDCVIGNHVIMGNAASLAGHVEVQDYAIVEPFCGIHQFCRVGQYAFLGAYSVINKDILPYSKMSATRPVDMYGANAIGLERRGIRKEEIDELQSALKLLSRSKLNTTQALEAIEARQFHSPHVRTLVEFIKTSTRGVAK